MRHGYGVRTSAAFGIASHSRGGDGRRPSVSSLQPGVEEPKPSSSMSNGGGVGVGAKASEEIRGGFVLKSRSDEAPVRRRSLVERTGMKNLMQGLKIRKQRSTGDLDRKGVMGSIRSTGSTSSWMSSESNYAGASVMSEGSQASFVVEDEMLDANVTETYMGEWKNDKRCGFGISERSDGLKYEGEWFNNRKYGYGVTTLKDGSREEGKYKNNILITSNKKKHLFLIRSAKFRERIDSAVSAAQRASKIALQKADIAISRTATARGKAEQADYAAVCARDDSAEARACAQTLAPEFGKPGGALSLEGGGGGGVELEHPPPPAPRDKLDLPAGKAVAGGGPPSPRGAGLPSPNTAGPGPPSPRNQGLAQPPFQDKPMANHIGNQGNVINKPTVPNPSLDLRKVSQPAPSALAPPDLASQPAAAAAAPVQNVAPPPARPQFQRLPSKPLSPPPISEPVRPQNNSMTNNSNNMSDISSANNNHNRVNSNGPAPPILSAPPPRLEPEVPAFPDPAVLRQPNSLQISEQLARGRTPTRQERARMAAAAQNEGGGGFQAGGGYNFQKIMDDRFEHYKRPPSRERSADRFGLGSRQGSRQQLSRDVSRDRLNRPASRQRTPMAAEPSFSENKPNNNHAGGLDGLNL